MVRGFAKSQRQSGVQRQISALRQKLSSWVEILQENRNIACKVEILGKSEEKWKEIGDEIEELGRKTVEIVEKMEKLKRKWRNCREN